MTEKEYTAEELCKQYMGRAKEAIVIAAGHITKNEEIALEILRTVQSDISMAMFQVGRVYQKNNVEIE